MKPECISAVSAVYGREATEAEVRAIEARLGRIQREMAARDPQAWLAKSTDDRMAEAAQVAAHELREEAGLKVRRQALQILAIARVRDAIREFPGDPMEALSRLVAFHGDAKGSTSSMEYRAKAIENDALRQMIGTIEATNPKFFGLIEDQAGIRDLVRELHGEDTGNAIASKGAELFRKIAEALRQRFNRAGGNVGRLEDWGMPHHHSQTRVARAGQEEWLRSLSLADRTKAMLWGTAPPKEFAREKWVADVLPRLDRNRYLRENGTRMDDTELSELLRDVWLTIATGGTNKLEPGRARGSAAAANHGSEHRSIHFKDADAYLDYQKSYGERSVYDVLIGHIESLSKDIAAVESFGPNPNHVFRMLRDEAMGQLTEATPADYGRLQKRAVQLDNLFNMASGKTLPVASARLAHVFDALRSNLVSTRLGSAVITSITDEGTMMRMASVNNLPQMQLWRNELAAFNPTNLEEKRLANRAGLALNTMVASLNRFGNEAIGAGWSSKLATATLRASGLNAMTEARRRAWGATMMSAYGQVTRDVTRLADLDKHDHRIMLSKGITDTDFEIWRRAEPEDWGNGNETMLTPDAIYRIPDESLADLGDPQQLREEAVTKLLGAVLEETDMAVIEPGLRERAMMGANLQRGTWKGELTRSAFLFKTFPLSMIMKQWARAWSEPGPAGRTRALLSLTTSSTLLGMVALQASMLRDGKDPLDMTDNRAWMAALLKGGALSIYGDFLFAKETEQGRGALATLLGPVATLVEEALALTWGNAIEASKGEETDIGAEAVRFAKNNTPGVSAAINLWYFRSAIDHMLLHDLQETVSPGYLGRMEDRAYDQYEQEYWWRPGEAVPERAPDFEAAAGQR